MVRVSVEIGQTRNKAHNQIIYTDLKTPTMKLCEILTVKEGYLK